MLPGFHEPFLSVDGLSDALQLYKGNIYIVWLEDGLLSTLKPVPLELCQRYGSCGDDEYWVAQNIQKQFKT